MDSSTRLEELCPHCQEVKVGPQNFRDIAVSTGEFSVPTMSFKPPPWEPEVLDLILMVCQRKEGLLLVSRTKETPGSSQKGCPMERQQELSRSYTEQALGLHGRGQRPLGPTDPRLREETRPGRLAFSLVEKLRFELFRGFTLSVINSSPCP